MAHELDSHVRSVYLTEVVAQCDFALNAVRGLNNVLARLHEGDGDVGGAGQTLHQEVFRSVHSFLTHASNVSRLLWPAPPRRKKGEADAAYRLRCDSIPKVSRGAQLRSVVGLPQEHVLRSRKLRDHLEHFDERLDHWQATSERRNYVQDFVGPKGSIAGIDEADMMRWFDPSTNHIRFRGEEFDLQALATAVDEVRTLCEDAVRGIRHRRVTAPVPIEPESE